MNYAVIGAGISGLAAAAMLREAGKDVTVFEKDELAGGLIRCERVEGCLFHRTGGHVFNTKRADVLEWFWRHFDRDAEFTKASRNSTIAFENATGGTFCVPYPIEDHVYLLDETTQRGFIRDLLSPSEETGEGFEGFLKERFGSTLYELYFGPYNRKVWRRDLRHVPLEWLEGKLPMPTKEQMIFNNMNRVEERAFVHSTFWYPKTGGSQFIVDRLARGTTIVMGEAVERIERDAAGKLCVNGRGGFDHVIYSGNVKALPAVVRGVCDLSGFGDEIASLESHGTTSVFCELDANPYSWIYLPSPSHEAHRIICTGNFSPTNNAGAMSTGTLEFTDFISDEDITQNLDRIPFVKRVLKRNFARYTYPIQNANTRKLIASLKKKLSSQGVSLLGRFAEWEYYNMDAAIGAAMDLCKTIGGTK